MKIEHAFEDVEKIISSFCGDQKKIADITKIIKEYRESVSLEFKSIRELLAYEFIIPSYQRGYKWKKQQVLDLLDDIRNFSISKQASDSGTFYCLQPIIVKKTGIKKWVVIDGQQRLTTIYLILTYLDKRPEAFTLEYNTREESKTYLKGLTQESFKSSLKQESFKSIKDNIENIDIYYFQNAMAAIQYWFKKQKYLGKDCWANVFLDVFLDQTKVIWYRPKQTQSDTESDKKYFEEINIFSRINSGKIPLTSSELIRALFIHHSKKSTNDEAALLQQNKIASEWDYIEQQLRDENFWCFVSLGKPEKAAKKSYPNRIEYLFDLMVGYKEEPNLDDCYSTFRICSEKINRPVKPEPVTELWQNVKNLYYRFHEWYIDRSLYHLTGYTRLAKIGDLKIEKLLEFANEKRQSELIEGLKKEILAGLFGQLDKIEEQIDTIGYSDINKDKVRKILLLFNVVLAMENENAVFFPFTAYLKTNWDLEHIHSRTPEKNINWLKNILDYWGHTSDDASESLNNRVFQALEKGSIDQKLVDEVGQQFTQTKDKDRFDDQTIDRVGNLCLLDSSTNRSYGNAPFPVKRKTIIKRISEGQFVPQGTQNVFLKAYSSNISDMMFWTKNDAQEYQEKIIETIKSALGETK